jgi:transposase InsO family protein
MAISNRQPEPDSGLIIHSDQGQQFTSWAFTRRARQSGLLQPMGAAGNCFYNTITQQSGCSPRSNMKHSNPDNPKHDILPTTHKRETQSTSQPAQYSRLFTAYTT